MKKSALNTSVQNFGGCPSQKITQEKEIKGKQLEKAKLSLFTNDILSI